MGGGAGSVKSEGSAGWLGYRQVISCGFRRIARVGFAPRCLRGISGAEKALVLFAISICFLTKFERLFADLRD
jgi:hypothetical protein